MGRTGSSEEEAGAGRSAHHRERNEQQCKNVQEGLQVMQIERAALKVLTEHDAQQYWHRICASHKRKVSTPA